MKKLMKKIVALLLISGFLSLSAMAPAMAWGQWGYYHASGYGWHPHYYPHPYYHYHPHYYNNGLATGLVVGGVLGLAAGSAITSSHTTYVENDYYSAPQSCYKERVWSHKFCNGNGCFVKTAWRTVCN